MGCTAYIKLTNWPTDQSAWHFWGNSRLWTKQENVRRKGSKCLKIGGWMYTRFFLPSVVWMTLDSGFIDSSIMSSWTERSAVKDLKSVSGCKQILRFALDDRTGGVELLSSRTERSAVKDLGCIKGVLMWMYTWMHTRFFTSFNNTSSSLRSSEWQDGEGAWSVGQLVSFYARTYLCVVSWWNGMYVLIGW